LENIEMSEEISDREDELNNEEEDELLD